MSKHRRAGVHLTPTNRARTRARETSPEGGPGDRVANFMGMMMMNQSTLGRIQKTASRNFPRPYPPLINIY